MSGALSSSFRSSPIGSLVHRVASVFGSSAYSALSAARNRRPPETVGAEQPRQPARVSFALHRSDPSFGENALTEAKSSAYTRPSATVGVRPLFRCPWLVLAVQAGTRLAT